jgi:hypothetical protein
MRRLIRQTGAILACVLTGIVACAQGTTLKPTPVSVGISPQMISLTAAPGSVATFDVHVKNLTGTTEARVWIEPDDAIQEMDGHLRFGSPPGQVPHSLGPWMTVPPGAKTVPAGKEIAVPVTIQVPAGQEVRGTYHGIIAVALTPPLPPPNEGGPTIGTGMRISYGIIVNVEIPGTREENVAVEAISISNTSPPGNSYTAGAMPSRWLVLRPVNNGNAMTYIDGWVTLRGEAGQLAGRWKVGSAVVGDRMPIYPGRRIEIYLPLPRVLVPGTYEAEARLNYGKGKIAGFKATMTVEAGLDTPTVSTGAFESLDIGLSVTMDADMKIVAVAPGGVRTGVFTVINNEASAMNVKLTAQDARMENDGTILGYGKGAGDPLAVANWLRVAPTTFTLAAGEQRRIQYGIHMPKNAPDAPTPELVALVRAEGRLVDQLTRTVGPESIGECGMVLLASPEKAGTLKCDLGVPTVRVAPEANNLILLGLPVQNTGTVHCFPTGNVVVTGVTNPVFHWESGLNELGGKPMVLAGAGRTLWLRLPGNRFVPGEYSVEVNIDYGGATPATQRVKLTLMAPPGETPDTGGVPTTVATPTGSSDSVPTPVIPDTSGTTVLV